MISSYVYKLIDKYAIINVTNIQINQKIIFEFKWRFSYLRIGMMSLDVVLT